MKYLLCFYLIGLSLLCHAQDHRRSIEAQSMWNDLGSIPEFSLSFPDSAAYYMFAIRVTVDRANNSYTIRNIESNNQIGLEIINKHISFHELDYKAFFKKEKQLQFVFPVSIYVVDSSGRKPADQGFTLAAMNLFFLKPNETRAIENYRYFKPLSLNVSLEVID